MKIRTFLIISCCLLMQAYSVMAQTESILVLPNMHVKDEDLLEKYLPADRANLQFGRQELWPNVGAVDLTKSISSLNTTTPNAAIIGTFNAGSAGLGTEGAVLFSMSEDYAMLQDGEFKDKYPDSEHGNTRSLVIIGVGKIPLPILTLLDRYEPALGEIASDHYDILKNPANNNQGIYVIVVDNNEVVQFYKESGTTYTQYIDGNWHSFAVYSIKNSARSADGLTVIVDGQEKLKSTDSFISSDDYSIFFDVSKETALVKNVDDLEEAIKDKNRRLTHSLLGACMVNGRYVTPAKSNLMLDNVGIFVGQTAINSLTGHGTGANTFEKMKDVSKPASLKPGVNFFSGYTPTTGAYTMNFNESDRRWVTTSVVSGQTLLLGSILNGSKLPLSEVAPPVPDLRAYTVDCSAAEPTDHIGKTLRKLRCPNNYPGYVMVVAHRGYHRDVPEHSLPSIQYISQLKAQGVDMVELDVRFTLDLKAVLMHDLYLDRLSTGTGSIEEKNWDDIKDLKLKNYDGTIAKDASGNDLHFVKLEDAFTILKDQIHIVLDIKTSGELRKDRLKRCLALAETQGMLHQIIAGGGSYTHAQMKAEYPEYFGKFLFIPSADANDMAKRDVQKFLREFIVAGDAPLVGIRYKTADDMALTPFDYIQFVKDYNVRPMIFARWPDFLEGNNRDGHDVIDIDPSTDERGSFDFIVENGATIITTDRPEILVDYLKAIGKH